MARNRFAIQKARPKLPVGLIVSVLFTAVLLVFLFQGMGSITDTTEAESLKQVRLAVSNAAVHCYAVEGIYPANLDYLIDNYGLQVDLDKYMVDYICYGSNLMPNITVLPRDFSALPEEELFDFNAPW